MGRRRASAIRVALGTKNVIIFATQESEQAAKMGRIHPNHGYRREDFLLPGLTDNFYRGATFCKTAPLYYSCMTSTQVRHALPQCASIEKWARWYDQFITPI